MSKPIPVLHMLCGKIASGKSTLATELSEASNTVLIREDELLAKLFGDRMQTGADFLLYSGKLRIALAPHVVAVLRAGTSVVLDFAANTPAQRSWMQKIILESGAAHQLHLLDPPEAVCLERLRARNASGTHEFAVTEEQFHRFAKHFVAPSDDEGFVVIRH